MAIPKCPKCESSSFQGTTVSPKDSNYQVQIIHCASCGCSIGVQPYYNTANLLEQIAKALKITLRH